MISVIIPVYNAEKYLSDCIESVLNQTYTDIEVICIDDGSDDSSMKILLRYASQDSRIIIVSQKNGGPNSARKAGLLKAKGDYVIFIDADDIVEDNFCEVLDSQTNDPDIDIVVLRSRTMLSDGSFKHENMKYIGKHRGKEIAERIISTKEFYIANIGTSLYPKLFRREIVEKIMRDFDERITYSEDVVTLMLACIDARKVVLCDEELYTQRRNPTSLTSNHSNRNYDSQMALFSYMIRELGIRKASDIMYSQVERLILRDLLLAGYKEAFGHLDFLFPFVNVLIGNSIVVYGAGAFGIELCDYIRYSKKYTLSLWVDKSFDEINKLGIGEYGRVSSPNKINEVDYDWVVIAITNPFTRKKVENDLMKMGVDKSKIATISEKLISYDSLDKNDWKGVHHEH